MNYKELTYNDLGIRPEELYEQMGYRDQLPDEAVMAETGRIVGEVATFLRPCFCYVVATGSEPAATDSPSLSIHHPTHSTTFSIGKIISRQLRGSVAYAVFICTAGMAYEHYQQRLMKEGDMVRVFIADALGSIIAEKCSDQMEATLQASIHKLGWKHTNRFSPGYCGWHVGEQQKLFPLLSAPPSPAALSTSPDTPRHPSTSPANPCHVQLTDSSLMVPIKSVSGIIGLGPGVRHLDYTCGLCDFKQCYKRRKPAKH